MELSIKHLTVHFIFDTLKPNNCTFVSSYLWWSTSPSFHRSHNAYWWCMYSAGFIFPAFSSSNFLTPIFSARMWKTVWWWCVCKGLLVAPVAIDGADGEFWRVAAVPDNPSTFMSEVSVLWSISWLWSSFFLYPLHMECSPSMSPMLTLRSRSRSAISRTYSSCSSWSRVTLMSS